QPADAWPSAAALATVASVEQRADVQAAQRRVQAAEQAAGLARAQRVRDIGLGVQVSRYPVSASNASGNGNTVSLSVTLPLFVRHAYDGEIARAEVDLGNAREALRRSLLAAQADLALARSRSQIAAARLKLAREQLAPAAEQLAAAAELAYRRGASPLLDLLDARRSLRAARIEGINAEADAAKAAAELLAAGTVWQP
ncbi:MAG: TolC family protein, partial [Rubrivivax sp.]|nr:TolC family protein [Rubrivivax sp.]